MEIIVTFLAMLELVKVRAIRIFQNDAGGDIIIEAAAGMDEAAELVVLDEGEEDSQVVFGRGIDDHREDLRQVRPPVAGHHDHGHPSAHARRMLVLLAALAAVPACSHARHRPPGGGLAQ